MLKAEFVTLVSSKVPSGQEQGEIVQRRENVKKKGLIEIRTN